MEGASGVAPNLGMQATPSRGRSRLDGSGRSRGAAVEPGTMSDEGGSNFRRVAIRRKSNPSYLPPGVPRPWSSPASHLGRAGTAAFKGQVPSGTTGKRLGARGEGGPGA